MKRGYFGIGIYHGKFAVNLGTLWRSAYQLGADYLFTIGSRYTHQNSDTVNAWKHLPVYEYSNFESFLANQPRTSTIVAVEMGGRNLVDFCHPRQAVYILGAEDHGLPVDVIEQADFRISIPAVNLQSYNVAVAGSLVMYDRVSKLNVGALKVS